MKRQRPWWRIGFVLVGVLIIAVLTTSAAPTEFDWQQASPESQGMSTAKLDVVKDRVAARKTKSLLVVRNDRIVYEWYAKGHAANLKHFTASLIKAILAGLSFGLAFDDGLVKLDDRAAQHIAEWRSDAKKQQITLRQLGSHTSGLDDANIEGVPHDKLPNWMGDFWKRLDPPNDPFTIARDRTPVVFTPGERLHYSNPGIAMLSYAVTAALKDGPQRDIRTLMRERVMRPIGVADHDWSVGYGQTFPVNGLPLVPSWGGGNYTARALARLGRLMLREGDWDGRRVLSKAAVRAVTGNAGLPGDCGIGWWTNAAGRYAKLPKDAFWGAGAGDQVVLVIPSLDLIVVRNGDALEPPAKVADGKERDVFALYHDPRTKILFEPIVDAVIGDAGQTQAPYPPSPVIAGIEWAPKESIVRKARGSDNWPLTWADDDQLYTAYGDGWGFEPKLPQKLGLGFARVEGSASAFSGVNIRSSSGEQIGDGAKAKKASGMLALDDTLYLWTRNAGNAQLAWSTDKARTWTWSDWKLTTSFGCPTFLNFGQNYAGARDDYVYIYSHDADSAYVAADRMVLARVPRAKIKVREAYEFYLGQAGTTPLWTKDIGERQGVFEHAGKCYRSGISYYAGLRRYLWCQILPGGDPRFAGGFGVYDAPEPWGPWTTVFYTAAWDVGPGETSSFPTKWMSADGKTLHLVFSGDDSFCVRRATLTLH